MHTSLSRLIVHCCLRTAMSDERIVQLKALAALQSGAWRLWITFPLTQIQDHIGTDLILASDIIQLSESLQVLQVFSPPPLDPRTVKFTGIQSCSYLGSINTDNHWPSYERHRSPINAIRKSLQRSLLCIYLLCLLNIPKFYASRLLMWTRNTEPLSQTCPSRNGTDSSLWISDNDLDCDVEFCSRVLITLLREWKTLRILSTVLFA